MAITLRLIKGTPLSYAELDGNFTTLVASIGTLESRADGIDSSILALDGRLDTAELDISTLEGQMTTAQTNISTLTSGLAATNSSLSALDLRVDDTETAIASLSITVSGHTSDLSALDLRLDTAESTLVSLDGRLDTAEATLTTLDGRVGTAESTLTSLDGRLDTAEATLVSLDSRLDTAELDIDTLTSTLSTLAHNTLLSRDASDAHPISAITGLQSALDGKASTGVSQVFTAPQRAQWATDNDGNFDFTASANWICTPTGSATLGFTVPSGSIAGQSGFIKLYNPSGYAISASSSFKIDSTLLSTISTAGSYLLVYSAESNSVVNLVASAALT